MDGGVTGRPPSSIERPDRRGFAIRRERGRAESGTYGIGGIVGTGSLAPRRARPRPTPTPVLQPGHVSKNVSKNSVESGGRAGTPEETRSSRNLCDPRTLTTKYERHHLFTKCHS